MVRIFQEQRRAKTEKLEPGQAAGWAEVQAVTPNQLLQKTAQRRAALERFR